jgi:type VI secretion system protein ImpH
MDVDSSDFNAALSKRPYAFGFEQALRQLECLHADRPRIGKSQRADEDPVRFAQEASLNFAPSTLAAFDPGDAEHAARLAVRFFGLLGPQGPLPTHLTEYARDRLRNHGDPTFIRFLDVFHHRMLALFYRAWAQSQPTVHADRPANDRFAAYVASLAGLGLPSLAARDSMPDAAKRHYAGRLSNQCKSAEGLEALLNEFFGLPVRVEEFVGRWIDVPQDDRCRLGRIHQAATLGRTTTIGRRVFDRQYKFRLVIGPLSIDDFQRLLPPGEHLPRVADVVRNYLGDELEWDLRLILRQAEVPRMVLGQQGRIGWTTWLAGRPFQRDAADLVLRRGV